MSLTEKPDAVKWPEMHYVFIEKIGPFQDTAMAAWQTLRGLVPEIEKQVKISGFMSLYKVEPKMIYRAGVSVAKKPDTVPSGLQYTKFEGGKYSRFTLTGPYAQLPDACGRVFEIVDEKEMELRDDFFIEHYVNDPDTTPEEKLVTQILVPTA